MTLEIRPAGPADTGPVTDILAEATAWLRTKGIEQWPDRFSDDFIAALVAEGSLFVAERGTEIVATVTLQWSDPGFWGTRADAGFIHRLAVRRSHSGVGTALIEWADRQAAARGRAFLCLDTITSNARLRAYYEDLGFREVGQISGPPEHPHSGAHGAWRATLYERPVRSGD
jgi:GNAT superfamily N-acetyltransferase